MIVITDLLRPPFDEGAKNTAYSIIKELGAKDDCDILSIDGAPNIDIEIEIVNVNRSFLDIQFLKKVKSLPHASVLYIPESSATIFSFIRSWLLSLFASKQVTLLALQPRRYRGFKSLLYRFLAPEKILTPSKIYADYLYRNNIRSQVIPLGVDHVKYDQHDLESREVTRATYGISRDSVVLLHVGHIRESRNLAWLLDVREKLPNIEVVIVGSSYNESDSPLYSRLKIGGVKVIDHYVENMAELYNMADYYLFPVVDDQGAIATPLSVLEAMSCNLPVITTRFGSLVDIFIQDNDLFFVCNSNDVVGILKKNGTLRNACNNRNKVRDYTWEAVANRILGNVEGAC